VSALNQNSNRNYQQEGFHQIHSHHVRDQQQLE
jgi:hypothetical protein